MEGRMIVNMLKDISWIDELEPHNKKLLEIHDKFGDLGWWFTPSRINQQPLSRMYPEIDEVICNRPEYKLMFNHGNYLSLFLIGKLYKNRKDVLIEDVGAGNGNLIYYLSKLGFRNFNTFDNWCECPKELFDEMTEGISCIVNDLNINPMIVNNVSAPRIAFLTIGLDPDGIYK